MNSRRRHRLYAAIAVVTGLGLASMLVMYALRSNIDLFYTPGEILNGKGADHAKPEPGQRLRVGGMVMPGSVRRDTQTLQISFNVYDSKGVISVSYNGILPDLFREGQGVVVQGVLASGDQVNAKEVLAKHDEKYTPPEITDALNSHHQGAAYQRTQGGEP